MVQEDRHLLIPTTITTTIWIIEMVIIDVEDPEVDEGDGLPGVAVRKIVPVDVVIAVEDPLLPEEVEMIVVVTIIIIAPTTTPVHLLLGLLMPTILIPTRMPTTSNSINKIKMLPPTKATTTIPTRMATITTIPTPTTVKTTPTIGTTNNPTILAAPWPHDLLLAITVRNRDTETIIESEIIAAVGVIVRRIEGDVGEVPVPVWIPTIAIDEAVESEAVNDTNPRRVSTVIPKWTTIRMIVTTGQGLAVIDTAVKVLPIRTTVVVEAVPVEASVERSDIITTTIIVPPVPVGVLRNEKDPLERNTSGITAGGIRIATRIEIVKRKRIRMPLEALPQLVRLEVMVRRSRWTRRRRPIKKRAESEGKKGRNTVVSRKSVVCLRLVLAK